MAPILGIWASSKATTAADTGAMFPLQVITVGSAGASSITFSNIPNTYTHLQLRFLTIPATANSTVMRVGNGSIDTNSNYAKHSLNGNGTNATGQGFATQSYFNLMGYRVSASTIYPSVGTVDILDYANSSKNKTFRVLSGFDANGSGEIQLNSGLWASTSAINTIRIFNEGGGNLSQYSAVALYGIKGA
jgi:hypothetical protein